MVWKRQNECSRRLPGEFCRRRSRRPTEQRDICDWRFLEHRSDCWAAGWQLLQYRESGEPDSHSAEFVADAAGSNTQTNRQLRGIRSELRHTLHSELYAVSDTRSDAELVCGRTLYRHTRSQADRLLRPQYSERLLQPGTVRCLAANTTRRRCRAV